MLCCPFSNGHRVAVVGVFLIHHRNGVFLALAAWAAVWMRADIATCPPDAVTSVEILQEIAATENMLWAGFWPHISEEFREAGIPVVADVDAATTVIVVLGHLGIAAAVTHRVPAIPFRSICDC